MPFKINPHPFEPVRVDQAKIDRITKLYNEEQANSHKITKRDEIPSKYEDITEEWLTDVLCKDLPNVKALSFKLGKEDDGTANRRHLYVEWSDPSALPGSFFCKATQGLGNRLNLCFGGLDSEIAWYNELRDGLDIEAPVAAFANFDHQSYNSIVILYDLAGAVTFTSYKTEMTKEMMESQLSLLASLHAKFYETKDLRVQRLITYAQGFQGWTETCYTQEAAEEGWAAAEHLIPPELFKAVNYDTWSRIHLATDRAAALPYTLCHCDVHIGNFYYRNDQPNKMGVTDFQCLARCPPVRDVAYCLATALPVERRREWDLELIRFYLKELKRLGGPALDEADFILEFRVQLWTSLVSWTPVYRISENMPDFQPQEVTEQTLVRLSHALYDWKSLEALEEIKDSTPRSTYKLRWSKKSKKPNVT